MSPALIRRANAADVPGMARVHVQAWRETYRGMISDETLDAADFVARREAMWTAALTDEKYAQNRAAVAEQDGEIVGIAMSGPALDADASWGLQLYVLYLLATHHGSGAGDPLLGAVVPFSTSTSLWVADPNPRAQAFYRKHRFRPDGAEKVGNGFREVRMLRAIRQAPAVADC